MKKWAAKFRRAWERWGESTEDYERSGRTKMEKVTTDENVEIVHSLVMCDVRRNLRDIASKVGMSFGAVQPILTAILGMSKVSARWVPRVLTEDQKRSRLDICRYFLSCYEDDPEEFMVRVVTQDEILVHHFDSEFKKKSMQWKHLGSPLPKNVRELLQRGR